MPSHDRLVAARYARALFDLASDNNAHDVIKNDMLMLQSVLAESRILQKFMVNPTVTREQAEKGIDTILAAMNASALTRQFFALLARNRRLGVAALAIKRYLALLAEAHGDLKVHVTSAHGLSESQLQLLTGSLARATGRAIEVKVATNAGLIGGMQVRIGSKMLDTSVAGKLARLQRRLTEAA
jgi:F-type H+-transporting ATPase subunit delta